MGDRPPLRDQLLLLAVSLIGTAAMVWMELPETQRMMILITARTRGRRILHGAARRLGHAGMGSELAAHMPSAHASYGLAYHLARLRDRL